MSKFILNRLSKDELIDLVLEQEKRHDEVMEEFRFKWNSWTREHSQASYSNAYSMKHNEQARKLLRTLVNIANELNSDEDLVSDTKVLDNISSIVEEACLFTIKDGKYDVEGKLHPHYLDIGEKYFKEHDEKYNGDDGLKAHWKKLYREKIDKFNGYTYAED